MQRWHADSDIIAHSAQKDERAPLVVAHHDVRGPFTKEEKRTTLRR